MGAIIFLGIFALVLVIGIATAMVGRGDTRIGGILAAVVAAILFGITFVANSVTNVEARTVGIVTEFGKATGTVSPGFNWVAPWASVTDFPTSNQVLDLDTTDEDPGSGHNVAVKFKGGGEGWVNVNITWQVQTDDKAVQLWNNWKDFELVKKNVVNPRGQGIVAEVFGRYAPEDATDGQRLPDFNKEVMDSLNKTLASSGIVVENVAIKKVDTSGPIQERINNQVKALADQNTSRIKQDTAKIDAETNKIAQQQLTPEVLANKCLDIVNAWDFAKNGPLPAAGICGGSIPLVKAVG
jgi:regulator of protease activity HflC (stomatin/prohibitin superfamily)